MTFPCGRFSGVRLTGRTTFWTPVGETVRCLAGGEIARIESPFLPFSFAHVGEPRSTISAPLSLPGCRGEALLQRQQQRTNVHSRSQRRTSPLARQTPRRTTLVACPLGEGWIARRPPLSLRWLQMGPLCPPPLNPSPSESIHPSRKQQSSEKFKRDPKTKRNVGGEKSEIPHPSTTRERYPAARPQPPSPIQVRLSSPVLPPPLRSLKPRMVLSLPFRTIPSQQLEGSRHLICRSAPQLWVGARWTQV